MASARLADVVCVADTGSIDGSVEALKALGALVTPISINPWRFDDARNAALALVPGDTDICVSLDLDTVMPSDWRAQVEAAWSPGTNMLYFDHRLGQHSTGQPSLFTDNRIHGRRGLRWKSPCHEYLVFDRTEERSVRTSSILMDHRPDPTKSRSQYMPLLQLAADEAPHEARASHVLARELWRAERWPEAVAEFERYLGLVASTPEERSMSLRLFGLTRLALGQGDLALGLFQQAARESPGLRGGWIDLACALYQRKDWRDCLDACLEAMALPTGDAEYGALSHSGAMPEDMASVCAWRLGLPGDAVDYARRALDLAPENARLKANLEAMRTAHDKIIALPGA